MQLPSPTAFMRKGETIAPFDRGALLEALLSSQIAPKMSGSRPSPLRADEPVQPSPFVRNRAGAF
jgi:hypothetical protein